MEVSGSIPLSPTIFNPRGRVCDYVSPDCLCVGDRSGTHGVSFPLFSIADVNDSQLYKHSVTLHPGNLLVVSQPVSIEFIKTGLIPAQGLLAGMLM